MYNNQKFQYGDDVELKSLYGSTKLDGKAKVLSVTEMDGELIYGLISCDRPRDPVYYAHHSNVFDWSDVKSVPVQLPDMVEQPNHYARFKHEPVMVILDWELDFLLGNVVKYVARAGYKGSELQDLKKAERYLKWKIELLETGKTLDEIKRGE
jgi:hypothetical protein